MPCATYQQQVHIGSKKDSSYLSLITNNIQ